MFLIKSFLAVILCCLITSCTIGQSIEKKPTELEFGFAFAGAEAAYFGVYSKVNFSLSHSKNYFYGGFGLNVFANFRGEIEAESKLKNDVDMRIIPNIFIAYNTTREKFDISVELPIGTSIAITRGTLINTKVGFERDYSNTEYLWHFGLATSIKYKVSDKSKIGFYVFSSLVIDKAWSPPMIGLSWIKNIGLRNK